MSGGGGNKLSVVFMYGVGAGDGQNNNNNHKIPSKQFKSKGWNILLGQKHPIPTPPQVIHRS